MPLILPGNVASATASTTYSIANSCRLNRADSAALSREMDDGNEDRWTLSFWVKRGEMANHTQVLTMGGSNHGIFFSKDSLTDALLFYNYISGDKGQLLTTRKFRDPAAWYHLVFVWDSGNGTAGNRMRIYVNGVEETVFATDTNPDQNQDSQFNVDGDTHYIGRESGGNYFDGYIAEYVFIDGTAYAASDFGEFNSDSPTIWQPKDPSGLTFGTNGVWLDFEDSSALGNDVSGNNNDFTPANLAAVDQATDSPTNNFCVLNPIDNGISNWTFLGEGNLEVQGNTTGGDYVGPSGTIGLTAGKWYWEGKLVTSAGAGSDIIGVTGTLPEDDGHQTGYYVDGYSYVNDGARVNNASHSADWGATYDDDDIISVALDLTNLSIYFAKNGTWQDSGDPTSGATGTGEAYTVLAPALTKAGAYLPQVSEWSSAGQGTWQFNFGGCPAFAISSAAADGNGYGTFEYAPPSGYLAICTKNLGSDGG